MTRKNAGKPSVPHHLCAIVALTGLSAIADPIPARGADVAATTLAAPVRTEDGAENQIEQIIVTATKTVDDVKPQTAPKAIATLTAEQLEKQVGLGGLVGGGLNYVPGVHFSGGDGTGISEGKFTIRGFSQDQIGFVRDGVPLNDPMYQTPHIDFMGDPENYQSVDVLYGSAAIDTPSLTSSGGSIVIKTVDPTKEPGLLVKEGFGSNNLFRTFTRINTGEYQGFSAWVSGSHTTGDLWTQSPGSEHATRFEGNLQYEWDDKNKINLIASSFAMKTNSYFNPTLAQYRSEPYDVTYQGTVPTTGIGTNGVADQSSGTGSLAALQRADFQIQTYGLNGQFQPADGVRLTISPYFVHVADGAATFTTVTLPEAYVNADLNRDGDKLDRTAVGMGVLPSQYRIGTTAKADIDITRTNTVQLGLWYDHTHANNQYPAFPITANGSPSATDGSDLITDANGNTLYFVNQLDRITTTKLWAQDTWTVLPDLVLTGGFAWQNTKNEGTNIAGVLSGSAYSAAADFNRLLPSGAISYQLDDRDQLYYDITSNMRTPAIASVYSTTRQAAETSLNQEVGWRYTTDGLLIDINAFYDQFANRQVSYAINNGATAYFNAGDVTTVGAEVQVHGKLPHNFNYSGSYSYVSSTQDSNYTAGGLQASTKGKQLFDTPNHLASIQIGYDDTIYYANITGRYTGSFYGDLTNSEKIASYTTVDLDIGYNFTLSDYYLKSGRVSFNVYNLFNNHSLTGAYAGSVSADPSSNFYAAPTYIRATPLTLFGNISFSL